MPTLMTKFAKNRSGATAIEYSLIGALTSIAIVSALVLMAGSVSDKFDHVAQQVSITTSR
ncbi:Flp family type IVb pilin [Paraburkholderia aspalathi]|nr:Flp family type IVb pilin [Paraburkholderia aspalathi]